MTIELNPMTLVPSFLGFSMFPAHLMQLLLAFCFRCAGSSCRLAAEKDPFCCYCNMRRSLQAAARMQFTWLGLDVSLEHFVLPSSQT